jgi:hypothetical protein
MTAISYFARNCWVRTSVRQDIVMVKQPGLFSPNFKVTSAHVFTQSPQNVTVEPGIHGLACWYKFFMLP